MMDDQIKEITRESDPELWDLFDSTIDDALAALDEEERNG